MINKITEKVDMEKLAEGYKEKRRLSPIILAEILEAMEESLDIRIDSKIADLGCGTGRFLIPLAKRNGLTKFVGVEKATKMLAECQKGIAGEMLKNVDLIKYDLEDGLPFADSEIDSAIVYHVYHLLDNRKQFVSELRRILKKNGKLMVASSSHFQLENAWNYKYMPKVLEWELRRTPDTPEVVKSFNENGFKLVRVKEINIKKKFRDVNDWKNFFRLRPISILSGIADNELEKLIADAAKKITADLGPGVSFEYGFDYHNELFFEKL